MQDHAVCQDDKHDDGEDGAEKNRFRKKNIGIALQESWNVDGRA